VEVAVSAPVDWEPFSALAPDQAPEAEQDVAFAEDQLRVALPPLAIALGPTLRLTVGVGDLTETVVDCAALPPGPLQVKMYVVLTFKAPVDSVPRAVLVPNQPPEAVHEVALVDAQVIVVLLPWEIVLGLALIWTVGAAEATDTVADCVAVPPTPVQVSVNVELALIGPVDCEPLGLRLPDHAPEAEHVLAFGLLQVSVAEPPEATVLGWACRVTAGAAAVTVTVAD
jgi:hypothetical protein